MLISPKQRQLPSSPQSHLRSSNVVKVSKYMSSTMPQERCFKNFRVFKVILAVGCACKYSLYQNISGNTNKKGVILQLFFFLINIRIVFLASMTYEKIYDKQENKVIKKTIFNRGVYCLKMFKITETWALLIFAMYQQNFTQRL